MTTYACAHCGWQFSGPTDRVTAVCPYCREENPGIADSIAMVPAEKFVPFSVSNAEFQRRISEFAGSIPFSPPDLNPELLLRRAEQVFLPRYLVDADVRAEWRAEMGFNYEVVSHQEILEDGRWKTVERKEIRERREPRLGRLSRRYENVPAPALEDDRALEARLGEFSGRISEPVGDKSIDSWIRLPERSFDDAWADAVSEVKLRAADECRQAAGADQVASFSWEPAFREKNWTLILLPVFTSYYLDDDGRVLKLIMNGQTGAVFGEKRSSERKAKRLAVTLALVAAGLILGSVVLGLLAVLLPLLGFVAVMLLLGGAAVGIGALLPVFTSRRFNRRARGQ